MTYQEIFLYLGGAISCLNLCAFAWRVIRRVNKPQSQASWLMWFILDALLVGTTWHAGKPIWLPLSYVVGAGSIMTANFVRGSWSWTLKESLCALGAAISAALWLTSGAVAGLVAGISAMTLAGIPLFIDLLMRPVRKTFPVWAWTVLACGFTLAGSDWTFTGTLLAWCGLAFNGALCIIVLRDRSSTA